MSVNRHPRAIVLCLSALAPLAGCTAGPPDTAALIAPIDGADGGPAPVPDGFYPRPGAPVPSFAPTPEPPRLPVVGTVVGVLDWPGTGAPSTEAAAVQLALSTMGIPSRRLAAAAELSAQQVAIVAGDLAARPATLASAVRGALTAGAAVLLVSPSAQQLLDLGGIDSAARSRDRVELRRGDPDDATSDLRRMGLRTILLAGGGGQVATWGYHPGLLAQTLLSFEDGSAALVRRGRLYSLGLGGRYHLDLLGGRITGLESRRDVPAVQGDVLPLLLRGLYRAHAAAPQVRLPAPLGRRAAVILTHDCDSPVSATMAARFRAIEDAHGVRSTFLLITTPHTGYLSQIYRPELVAEARAALAAGYDVQSHSFGHFPDFAGFPDHLADPTKESAAAYLPHHAHGRTEGASVTAELGVSRWLLEQDLGITVEGFRPGDMAFPPFFYEAAVAAGYRRTSARLTKLVRTHFPHPGVRLSGGVRTYPVIEYPLAISDHDLSAESDVDARLAEWLEEVDRSARYGAPTVLLLHPSSRPGKLTILGRFLDALERRDVWVGDWASYAAFYEGQGF